MATASIAAGSLTQNGRVLQIDTTLGQDVFVIRSVHVHEAVSELFEVNLELASENFQITPSKIIAQQVAVRILFDDSDHRPFHGFVNRFSLVPSQDHLAHYRMRLVPALWFLTRTTNCAIFQNKTTPEIVEAIFKRYGVSNYKMELTGTYAKREYCVQYRETAFDFISRLLEEEGICYYFQHTPQSHTVILADSSSGHGPCELEPEVIYQPASGKGLTPDASHVQDWVRTVEIRPTKWTQADFEFKQPRFDLIDTEPSLSKLPVPDLERYDYPGRFNSASGAQQLTRVRMEEDEGAIDTIAGRGNCRGLAAGYTFKIKQNYRPDQDGNFLLTAVEHQAEQGSLYAGDDYRAGKEPYTNTFRAIPADAPFRPARTTPRPYIRGPQTAFVTGPKGEEIYVDQYGRVKVQFHWDREGKCDEVSSCWVRVSQSIAGKSWGAVQLPRVGHEVIVEFLEGDPDRPLITGRVYNADHVTPYKLPDEKSKSTLKTLSYPGGGGFNELRMEDKKGSEQVFIHGEKDLDVRIKNDSREWIGRDRHLIVQRDKIEQISRDKHETIQRDQVEQITRDHHVTISGKEAIAITGSHSLAVTGDVIEQFSANQSTQVTGSVYVKGMNVVVEAMTGLTINVGGNFITINSAGIQITGTMVLINSGGAALPGTAGNLVSPISPLAAAVADDAKPGDKGEFSKSGQSSGTGSSSGSSGGSSSSSNAPWHDPNNPDNKDKKSWIEIELLDQNKKPVAGEPYRITLPDGQTLAEGTLDDKGQARVEGIDPGTCKVTFPQRDKRSWKPK
jgi:type VI secretion system secreted protein VgrG